MGGSATITDISDSVGCIGKLDRLFLGTRRRSLLPISSTGFCYRARIGRRSVAACNVSASLG